MFQELVPVPCFSLPLEREAVAGKTTGMSDAVVVAATAGGWVWVSVLVETQCEQRRCIFQVQGSKNCRRKLWARGWCLQLVNASRAGHLAGNPRRLSACLTARGYMIGSCWLC